MKKQETDNIFIWKDFSEWKPRLEAMFPDILTPKLADEVREIATHATDDEGIDVLDILFGLSSVPIITREKAEEFRQLYSHIRLYHACRPKDISSYEEEGILLSCKENQVRRFREIFPIADYPEITDEKLQESIEELRNMSGPDGVLDLLLDYREFVEVSGQGSHILIHGSEYLLALVSHLRIENRERCLSELRKIGKPTIIKIKLPNTVEYIDTDTLKKLIYDMMYNWIDNVAHSLTECGYPRDSFEIRKIVPSNYICGYNYPTKIRYMRQIYDVETREFEDIEEQQNQIRKLTPEQAAEAQKYAEAMLKKAMEQRRGKLQDSE